MPKVEAIITFTRDEVQKAIPYAVVCETRYGSSWNTAKRRRRWLEEFSEEERERTTRMFGLAHRWTLVSGVPDEVKMSNRTFALWMKLGNFCGSI